MTHMTQSAYYHGHRDNELTSNQDKAYLESVETKQIIVQERDISYRFYPHFHPYVGRLMKKLLREGTRGLQAADTEYAPDDESLPASIEFELDDTTVTITIPQRSRIALTASLRTTLPDNSTITLAADMQFSLTGITQATLPDGLRATLVDGMKNTPLPGGQITPPPNSRAFLSNETTIRLSANTPIFLHNGDQATLPAGSEVLLAGGTHITLPANTPLTLRRSRPRPLHYSDIFTDSRYKPSALVQRPYPVKDLDFTSSGAYAIYNWELFFHVPFTIAIHLSKNQRFAEAQRWFHFIFDPTDDSDGPTPERFWKVRPFQYTDVKKVEEVLVNLATGDDTTLRNETINNINAWGDAPFRPHVIASFRQQAYMYKTVMAYLDNLIAWGDSLFRQDTGEAIDEAQMLYVLAANILGPRPQAVPQKGTIRPQTYDNLRKDLSQFGAVMREIEADSGFDLMPFPAEAGATSDQLATVRSLGKALYFCVPRNDKLLSYWDTVADRLFKIRNSLNIQGIFRQLALFEPPIDPAMLARAAAAGLDVGAIVNGLNQPLPLVRFQLLAQRAAEIVQEVKSLGNNLLSAMEKEDGEALAVLRARHERVIMEMVEHVRYAQLQEAIKSKEGLLSSLALIIQRYVYYELQLGNTLDDIEKAIPELGELDKDSLAKMDFSMTEREVEAREIEVDIATDVTAQAAQALSGGKILSSHEVLETLLLELAQASSDYASYMNVTSSIASALPDIEASAEPWGMGAASTFGGQNIASAYAAVANATRGIADRLNFEARRASRIDSFARRERDWAFQSNLAAGEISQTFKQIRAAQIREAVAEQELKNHQKQMEHAREIEQFLNEEGTQKSGKKTNKAFYAWMKREVKGLYAQCFQFAFDVARKAERALQHELGNRDLSFLQFGYLAGKEGLLAGEKLYLDVKRMEMAYLELNQREYELTKHISLLQLDPLALIQLRATGRCTVRLPEELFDMDGPGHYFRRIKSVAVSIPCVTGPYTGVNCTLTLLKSSIRTTPVVGEEYARADAEDPRFSDYFGSLQSIVTSSAQNDSGLFETNLRDERYLPFENSGTISEWQLELPADIRQFDYNTISDVILHVRYTAREGGGLLRKGATENLNALIDEARAPGSVRIFSMRHEFPSEWAKFKSKAPNGNERYGLRFALLPEHYPFWAQDRLKGVARVDILVRSAQSRVPPSLDVFEGADKADSTKKGTMTKDAAMGDLLVGQLDNAGLPAKPVDQELQFYFDDNTIKDLWMAVTWSSDNS